MSSRLRPGSTGSLQRETPLIAGFRQSGAAYLPPGQTSCEAGMHQAGFCAREKGGNTNALPTRHFRSPIA